MDAADHEATMRAYYGERAPLMRYDGLQASTASVLDDYAAYVATKLRGRRVLEVACGTGFWTHKLAEHAEQVLATDAVPNMLREAQARTYARANVRFALADAFELEQVPGGWNGGFHMQWFSHVPRARIATFLSGFHRRLQPGAVVVFGDNKDRGDDPDAEGNRYQERVPGRAIASSRTGRARRSWPKPCGRTRGASSFSTSSGTGSCPTWRYEKRTAHCAGARPPMWRLAPHFDVELGPWAARDVDVLQRGPDMSW